MAVAVLTCREVSPSGAASELIHGQDATAQVAGAVSVRVNETLAFVATAQEHL